MRAIRRHHARRVKNRLRRRHFVRSRESVNVPYTCDGAASVWGDRAKMVAVFVGDAKAEATQAFIDTTWGMTIEGSGRNAKLWLGVSAEACGKPPARDFASENFCDRAIVWDGATRTFDYAPLSTVRHLD